MPIDEQVISRDTYALQSALDGAHSRGGGEVRVPAGRHVVGTLRIHSNTTLVLPQGAVLAGSTNLGHYPEIRPELRSYSDNYTSRSLIYAERATKVSIVGRGVIDGQGGAFLGRPYHERPYLMRLVECEDVIVRDIELRDSAMWVQHYLACERVLVDGIRVTSRCNINNDGIDIDSCTDFRLSNSSFDTEDDAICLKATSPRPCSNVVVTNCVMSTDCNGFKIGTETVGSFSDIVLSNSTMFRVGLAAVALESVDGGHVERVSISNVTARDASAALFIRLGDRGRPYDAVGTADYYDDGSAGPRAPVGRVTGITINNFAVSGCDGLGSSITGTPTVPISDVSLTNLRWNSIGGGVVREEAVPESLDKYPEYRMFGVLPAHGLFARHVDDLHIDNVRPTTTAPDDRPAFEFQNVQTDVQKHVSLKGNPL